MEATSHIENNFSVIENPFLQSTQNRNGIIPTFDNKVKCEAEIIWSFFCVRHGFSDNSMTNFLPMFSRMFPGVDNVKNVALGKDRIKCCMYCSIYPYFKELLKVEVNNSQFIVTCFDEC